MDTERVDRYVVAAGMLRFWWVIAVIEFATTAWLLRSIVSSLT